MGGGRNRIWRFAPIAAIAAVLALAYAFDVQHVLSIEALYERRLALKGFVADGERFIHDQDIGLHRGRDGEGKADGPGDPPTHLEVVDRLRVDRVRELDGGPPGVQQGRPAAVVVGEGRLLAQAKGVPVEGERRVVVGNGEDESQLARYGQHDSQVEE